MNVYSALVIHLGYPSAPYNTYIGANTVKAARRKLEREGFKVIKLWVFKLAAA